jgi:hypothetical protein
MEWQAGPGSGKMWYDNYIRPGQNSLGWYRDWAPSLKEHTTTRSGYEKARQACGGEAGYQITDLVEGLQRLSITLVREQDAIDIMCGHVQDGQCA